MLNRISREPGVSSTPAAAQAKTGIDFKNVLEQVESLKTCNLPDLAIHNLGVLKDKDRNFPMLKITLGNPDAEKKILISGGVHGDEPAGVFAAIRFVRENARDYLDRCCFEIYPCVNPSGVDAGRRKNSLGADLNRHFDEDTAQEENRLIVADLQKGRGRPFDLVIDLHEDDRSVPSEESTQKPPAGLYAYETCRDGQGIAEGVLRTFPDDLRCRDEVIYGDKCVNGVLYSGLFQANSIYAAGKDLEGFVCRTGIAKRAMTFETIGEVALEQRIKWHSHMLNTALKLFLGRTVERFNPEDNFMSLTAGTAKDSKQELVSKAPGVQPEPTQGNVPVPGKEPILGCHFVKSAEDVEYLQPAVTADRPTLAEIYDRLQKTVARRNDLEMIQTDTLHYETSAGPRDYPYFMIKSRSIGPDDPILVIRANVHGREIGSGLSVFQQAEELVEAAHSKGVKVVILPMDNPSAYETMNYRNIWVTEQKLADRDDWMGNNVGPVYVLKDGREVGDIGDGKTTLDPITGKPFEVTGWKWADETSCVSALPDETRAALKALRLIPIEQVKGMLDFHQDPFCTIPLTYQFGFGEQESFAVYDGILAEVGNSAKVMRNHDNEAHPYTLDNYQGTTFKITGDLKNPDAEGVGAPEVEPGVYRDISNDRGFIVHHDGTLPCLFERMGAKHSMCVEISSVTPQENVNRIVMAWVTGISGIIARESKK